MIYDKEIIPHTHKEIIRTHTRKQRRVAHVCETWYVVCINGTRRGLRMTLSGKCSGLCIVIPVEYRRWLLYQTYIRAQSFSIHLAPNLPPSEPISYFLRFFAVYVPLPQALDEARSASYVLFRPRCGRDSDDRSSIKSNNVSMNAHAAVVIRYAFA